MTRPTTDLAGRLRTLDSVTFHALSLPDVPEERRARLQETRDWASSHERDGRRLPRPQSPEEVALEAELRARHEYVEQDRRAYPIVGRHLQSTEADGSGPAPDLTWPYSW
jgi:hypothetical protein